MLVCSSLFASFMGSLSSMTVFATETMSSVRIVPIAVAASRSKPERCHRLSDLLA
ncbi:hypothetical protein SynSYN20_02326 [Synechococcus sp. SYN20]|nr:hypothetical protein SynSYN20_02326 [Synechococcus sp. SYN20]